LAKKARVWTGTEFVELASAQTDLTAYSTTAQMNTAITAGVGLVPILTQTIGAAVTSITVSNAFSATYDNYKILVSGGTASASTDLTLKLGASATGYYSGRALANYSSGAYNSGNDSNASVWNGVGRGATTGLNICVDLISPFLAKTTAVAGTWVNQDINGAAGSFAGFHNSSVSYSDFTIATGGTTLTGGTIRVYGYKN
jgi:hypothetical protein